MSYVGVAISLWPYIVPRHFTLWEGRRRRRRRGAGDYEPRSLESMRDFYAAAV